MSPLKAIVFSLIVLVTITTVHPAHKKLGNHLRSKKRSAQDKNESIPHMEHDDFVLKPSDESTVMESSTGSLLPNLSPTGNKTIRKKSLNAPYVKAMGKWHSKRAGHGHKIKKVPSVSYSNYYEPDRKQSSNWNYGNRGYQPAYSPPKAKWTNPGYKYQSKSSPSQGYSNPYYSPVSKSNAIDTKSGSSDNSASQGLSSLYYSSDKKSNAVDTKPSYKTQQKNPPASYSNYYSPGAKSYQKGSYKNTAGSGRTQNKPQSVAYSNYYSPAAKSNPVPAKSNQPSSNRGQQWNAAYKGKTHSNAQPSNSISSGAKSQQNWNKNTGSASQSKSSPQQGYSNLYYSPGDTKSKASRPVSSGASQYGGNYNSRQYSAYSKNQPQWSNKNADTGKKSGEQSQSFLNYYSHRKRSMEGNVSAESSTTGMPNTTSNPGFIAEFFHEHIIGNSSTTPKSDGLFGSTKRNVTKRQMDMKRHVAESRLMKRKRKHVEIEIKPDVTTTANPNTTSRLGFIGDYFHNLFGGNSSSGENKTVSKRQMELKTQDENGKGEKHLVALTFSIREQQVKATFSDSQNVSQVPGEEDEDAFTTPSMEDMLKKENAMLMDLVKVVSNGVANNKPKSNTGASQIAQAISSNPGHLQPQKGNMHSVNHPQAFNRRPIEKKHMAEVKRTEGSVPVDTNDGNVTQVEKKHIQKETITKVVQKPKSSVSGSRFPGGRKNGMKSQGRKQQKPPTVPSVQEPQTEEAKDEDKLPEPESPVDEPPGNELDDSGEDSVEGGADVEVAKNGEDGEDLPNNDDNEIDIIGKEADGEESMDEDDVPKNKNTGTLERVVIEESKKFKSKLTETFEKNAEDSNTMPDNSEDENSDVTEEALPAGEKKLVDKTAKMMEALSILYKLAGNESESNSNDVIRRDGKDSVSGSNSTSGNNSISERDSIPPKDSNAHKDSISERDSIPPKDSNADKDSITEKNSISERGYAPPKDSNLQKGSMLRNNSISGINSIAGKENTFISSGAMTTAHPIIENVSIALASSLPTIDATAKKNRKRKFAMERRESNEFTTANGAEGKNTTPWTQVIREATQEDIFTEAVSEPSFLTSGVLFDPDDNSENIKDDTVDTTKKDGTLQTEFMYSFTNGEPSTIEIDNVGDDFTTAANMDPVI